MSDIFFSAGESLENLHSYSLTLEIRAYALMVPRRNVKNIGRTVPSFSARKRDRDSRYRTVVKEGRGWQPRNESLRDRLDRPQQNGHYKQCL